MTRSSSILSLLEVLQKAVIEIHLREFAALLVRSVCAACAYHLRIFVRMLVVRFRD